jgi:hypothetical protein
MSCIRNPVVAEKKRLTASELNAFGTGSVGIDKRFSYCRLMIIIIAVLGGVIEVRRHIWSC